MVVVAGGGGAQSCQFPRAAVESLLVAMGSKKEKTFALPPSCESHLLLPLVLRVPAPKHGLVRLHPTRM